SGNCWGRSSWPSRRLLRRSWALPESSGWRGSGAEDEREGETEDGQRLGEGEAEEGDRLEEATGLGLTGDAVDVRREDEADADSGADGREAVAEDRDVSGHGDSFPFLGPSLPAVPVRVSGPRCGGCR